MAARVQAEDIIKMNELYLKIGTYAGVARVVGFAPSTVKRYIQPDYVPQSQLQPIEKVEIELPDITSLSFPSDWNEFLALSEEESKGIKELQLTISM